MASSRIRKKKTVPNDFVAIEDFVFDGDDLFDDLAFEMEENEHFNDDETQCENLHSVDAYSDEESHNVNEHGVIDEEKSIATEQKEKEKKVGSNSYTCSYCVKVYKTLSGRTRHEKNVHNDRDKPVHNKAKGTEDDNGLITTSIISHGAKHVHADISTEEVWENMSTVIHHTLQEMQNNKHLSIKGSAYGNQVVAVAKCVAENSNIIAVLSPILKDRYLAEFIKATSVKSLLNGGVRETLFKSFDEIRMDASFLSSFQSVLDDAECIVDGFKRFTKLFISCFIRQFSVEVLKRNYREKDNTTSR
ncbi:uncharacterized protein LOC143083436 [Mytilus galloprovincialis]|uniref:uncharacterized protein LOC143083436 n=1 Tax=Mytilus galloprovincialis TaxID=29158 RepID=UPI003F7C56F0